MRIALVHDYLKEYGGAESVLETLSDIFPDAPIYTAVYHPQSFGPHRSRLESKWSHRVHQSFFQYLPLAHRLLSPLRFLSPLAFSLLDFKTFDLIITSATGAFFPNALNKKSAKLICYCHTPPRYLYGLPTAKDLSSPLFSLISPITQILFHFYRLFDFTYAQNVDQFIANSATTASRIRKFYRRSSIIINPPVNLPKLKIKNVLPALSREGGRRPEGFFLTGGRLAHAKRFDIAILACNQLKLPLKIFGRDFAGCQSELEKIAKTTSPATAGVEFLGEVSQQQKSQLYSEAQAYIFSSDNEEFGIVAVEAMAHGCPVIGYRSGGITETVIDGQTGILFDQLTPDSCAQAITRFQKTKFDKKLLFSHAQQFSKAVFIRKIKSLILNT